MQSFFDEKDKEPTFQEVEKSNFITSVVKSSFGHAHYPCNRTLDDIEVVKSDSVCLELSRPSRRAWESTRVNSSKSLLRQTEDLLEDEGYIYLDLREEWAAELRLGFLGFEMRRRNSLPQ